MTMEEFVSSMMNIRKYVPKKKKHSWSYANELQKKVEEEIDDKIPEWFSRMAIDCDISEDEVREFALITCMREHERLCFFEKHKIQPQIDLIRRRKQEQPPNA